MNKTPEPEFDRSFKNFLKIMGLNNLYIWLFILFLGILIYQITEFRYNLELISEAWSSGIFEGIAVTVAEILPLVAVLIIFFKTRQYWNNLKNGRSM